MELYKLTAEIVNTSETFAFEFLPENFDGIKITQEFSFVNPIGFTPKFSVDTMRIIENDKNAIDAAFLAYGLNADVKITIYKLNGMGYGYSQIGIFSIDFESYEIFDDFSEFALKSISVIDKYNSVKSSEIQLDMPDTITIPNTQYFINYISLKSNGNTKLTTYPAFVFQFEQNNESKVFDSDVSLTELYIDSSIQRAKILTIGQSEYVSLRFSFSGKININIDFGYSASFTVKIYRDPALTTGILTLLTGTATYDAFNDNRIFEIPETVVSLAESNYSAGDYFYIAIEFSSVANIPNIDTGLFFDIRKITGEKLIFNDENITVIDGNDLLRGIFGNDVVSSLSELKFTSANSLLGIENKLTLKPSEFLSDLCAVAGLIVNFKKDGKVYFEKISTYFNNLLAMENVVEIEDYKDFSISYLSENTYASVSVGQETPEYDVFSYLISWVKILTFKQEDRTASETLDLSSKKLRSDFSGVLDYFYKKSKQTDKNSKDYFILKSLMSRNPTTPNLNLYDYFTPRDIIENWRVFLSFCFQSFGFDTLTLSSNGGTPDNLAINGVYQLDDIKFNEDIRLSQLKITFTCLIDDVDFSEKIIKINHRNENYYIFVIKSETTDKLSEQQITGVRILGLE